MYRHTSRISRGLALLMLATALPVVAKDSVGASMRSFEAGLRPAVSVEGEPQVRWRIEDRMAHWKIPGVSIAVIRDGRIAWSKAYGVKTAGTTDRVDTSTVFSVGSLSKVGTAAVTLRLVDAGRLDLDRNVNDYLKRWQVPKAAYLALRPVTLAGLMSHSAGLTLDGFPDFKPGESLPGVLDTLEGKPPSKTEPVRVFYVPGSAYSYSGGGTTVEQLLIEDVTGMPFAAAAKQFVFEPLGMSRSTYENPLPEAHGNIAHAHDDEGRPTALPRGWEAMPEMAASGLWTTPSDYARMVIAFIQSNRAPSGFLAPTTARRMMTEVGHSQAGLGPFLDGHGMTRRFSHSGSNDSYQAWMEGHLATGDGVVIFTNGANGWDLLPELRRAVAVAEGWFDSGTVTVPRVALSEVELKELEGLYEVSASRDVMATRTEIEIPPVALRVASQGGRLRVGQAGEGGGSEFLPEDPTHFVESGDVRTRVEFVRGYGGRIEGLIYRHGDYAYEATRR